jgi:CP family cyanate transporter-like MFS transporter
VTRTRERETFASGRAGLPGRVLLVAGLILAGLNMRPALAGLSPLLDEIMAGLGLTPAEGGAITTIMVVCLGLFGPAAPVLASRLGLDRTLLVALLVLAAGIAVRSAGGTAVVYVGAAIAGTAIAIMNVTMPALVKQHFPRHIGLSTSAYVTALVLGASTASVVMVPIEQGYGWRVAAGSAAALALGGALLWAPQGLGRRPVAAPSGPRPYRTLLRSRTTWYITLFMGLQSATFYITLAWLPSIFRDAGLSAAQAGYLLGLANVVQVGPTLLVPIYAARARSQAPPMIASGLLTLAGYVAVLVAPVTVPWLWMIVLGLGQGTSLAIEVELGAVVESFFVVLAVGRWAVWPVLLVVWV